MTINIDSLLCYKETKLTADNKVNFFLDKHSTKEGTWGELTLESGEIDFIFLDGDGKELSCIHLNHANNRIVIPPASWHRVKLISTHFSAILKFHCKPHRYLKKKYNLGNVQSDLLYVCNNYISSDDKLTILDVGCGKGRNLLYLALLGHQVTGIDINKDAIDSLGEIVKKEQLDNVKAHVHDLHQPLMFDNGMFDFILSTVSLQFLNEERMPSLLSELQQVTKPNGLHLLVFPLSAQPFDFPASFTYLPKAKALYHFYQDSGWAILEYNESVGQLDRIDKSGKPIQGKFALLLAQKLS